ncbi:hypothetical protein FACS189494_01760 [Spirochaetia bacterium]|nr:hypothetical protein FACS189494_01760 [Spirochaetia bacterium]
MKKSKLFLFGMIAVLAAGSLFMTGCESPTNGTNGAPGANGEPIFPAPMNTAQLQAAFANYDRIGVKGDGATIFGTVPAGKTLNIYGVVRIPNAIADNTLHVEGTLNITANSILDLNTGSDTSHLNVSAGGTLNIAGKAPTEINPIEGGRLMINASATLYVADSVKAPQAKPDGRVNVGAGGLLYYSTGIDQINAASGYHDTDVHGNIYGAFRGVSNGKIEIANGGYIGTALVTVTDPAKLAVIDLLAKEGINYVYAGSAIEIGHATTGVVATPNPVPSGKTLVAGPVTTASGTTFTIDGTLWTSSFANTDATSTTITGAVYATNATIASSLVVNGKFGVADAATVTSGITGTGTIEAQTLNVNAGGSVGATGGMKTHTLNNQVATPVPGGSLHITASGDINNTVSATFSGLAIGTRVILDGDNEITLVATEAGTVITEALNTANVKRVTSGITTVLGATTPAAAFSIPDGKYLRLTGQTGNISSFFNTNNSGGLELSGTVYLEATDASNAALTPSVAATAATIPKILTYGNGSITLISGTATIDTVTGYITPQLIVANGATLAVGGGSAAAATDITLSRRLDVHAGGTVIVTGATGGASAAGFAATVKPTNGAIIDGTLTITAGDGGTGGAGGAATVTVTGGEQFRGNGAITVTGGDYASTNTGGEAKLELNAKVTATAGTAGSTTFGSKYEPKNFTTPNTYTYQLTVTGGVSSVAGASAPPAAAGAGYASKTTITASGGSSTAGGSVSVAHS